MNICRWCGKQIKKTDDKVLLDFRMKFYDHKRCNDARWEARHQKYGDAAMKPKEQPKLTDFEKKEDENV